MRWQVRSSVNAITRLQYRTQRIPPMPLDDQPPRLDYRSGGGNLLSTILTMVAGVALLVAGFVFSLVILSVVAVVALVVWAWFWWKTRALRRHLGEQMEQMQREQHRRGTQDAPMSEGVIVEG